MGKSRAALAVQIALVAACACQTACYHPAQIWPSPLTPGTQVTANFIWPRAISMENDSMIVVRELRGTVVTLFPDRLVMRLTGVPEQPTRSVWAGRAATVPLDSATTITRSEFNESGAALMAVAGIAVVFAVIGSLPP